jgi:phosphatidylserine/phosphatidylglycerophosphate/cardiolipin synthase-like enzyme
VYGLSRKRYAVRELMLFRILDDYGRKSDPHKSRTINQNAIRYLHADGIACRYDRADKLLHSKFLTIDGVVSVIGSHNWTAGSYFKYSDLSVRIQSGTYAHWMRGRFRQLWLKGSAVHGLPSTKANRLG